MSNGIQTNLCKSIRACGLPKAETLELVNTINKWVVNNGEQWTVDRLKAYKLWYEQFLAGRPEPPAYFRKTKDNLPTGCFGRLFRTSNQQKVLAVLSAGTLFQANELTDPQREKFVSALKGDSKPHSVGGSDQFDLRQLAVGRKLYSKNQKFYFRDVVQVTPEDMTGTSIPLVNGKTLRLPKDPYERVHAAANALIESWRSVPQAAIEYLDRIDHLDWIPDNLSDLIQVPKYRHTNYPIGRIGLIQEPQLKLRSVANPNRVAQALTYPLAKFWEQCMGEFPSDCTFDQYKGIRWVQRKLKSGMILSGSDLSSATDLLDLDCCLQLAKAWCGVYLDHRNKDQTYRYDEAVRYFRNLSRGEWETPKSSNLGKVRWEQGQPLGLYPSFRLLAITNNSLGLLAASRSGLDPWDSFVVVGDDIIMDHRMEGVYTKMVENLGGAINRSKTITSDKVAEFAGRVITPDRVMLKTIKFKQPSDDSFMQIVSDLGPQAVGLLANRQRKAWKTFKYVPGIAYDGPWSQDSFGEPLAERVAWTESTKLVDKAPDPDPQKVHLEQVLIRAVLEKSEAEKTETREVLADLPWPVEEDIQSSLISGAAKPSGDPRRVGGLSTLERLERAQREPGFLRYEEFKGKRVATPEPQNAVQALPLDVSQIGDTTASPNSDDEGQDREDGDEPEISITATGGVQRTGEPTKGLSESTEGSKPTVVDRGPQLPPGSLFLYVKRMVDRERQQELEESDLEDQLPTNPK